VPRRFVFRHPLVRRAVYESTPRRLAARRARPRRRGARERAARAVAERAHHVEQSAEQGDEDAIALLLEAGATAASRAPAAAARWFEAALRLLPAADDDAQVDVRVALASALRSSASSTRAATTLLEAIERCRPTPLRGGRADRAVRGGRALARTPRRRAPAAAAGVGRASRRTTPTPPRCRSSLRSTACTSWTSSRRDRDGAGARSRSRARSAIAALIGGRRVGTLPRRDRPAGASPTAREHRDEASPRSTSLSDSELAPRLEALYYLGWAENYLERYDDAIAHAERGVAIARATGEGRLLVPMMLGKAIRSRCRDAWPRRSRPASRRRDRAPVGHPHYLFWALFELGWAHYYAGDLDGAIAAAEESRSVGGGCRRHDAVAGGGPGWGSPSSLRGGRPERRLGDRWRARRTTTRWAMPVERCFDWESLALVELAVGNATRPDDTPAGRGDAAAARAAAPDGARARTRAAVLLARATRRPRRSPRPSADGARRDRRAAPGRVLAQRGGAALAAAGERSAGDRAAARGRAPSWTRAARCACATRLRRELRKLGARAEPRGPAPRRVGVSSLTKRELEIADLVTDRMTNREIAAALFLSDKTIESHMRNLFMKLGVSSRSRSRARSSASGPLRRGRLVTVAGVPLDADAARLAELGYDQQLTRSLRVFDNARWGSRAISPVVGLYAVVLVGTLVAGPAWVWVLPVALAGQCLLLRVYAELASEFPIAGGAYQWSRRLMGGAYGWLNGWVAICAYSAANTTVAYLGAPWALTLLGIERDGEPRSSSREWSSSSSARSSARSAIGVLGRAIKARHRGRGRRVGRDRARAAARLSRAGLVAAGPHARRRGTVGRVGRRRACSRRSRSAAGSSSASTRASARRRRRGTRRATCRARSGSRCSASARS
jgi:DNA-binding CsgD family transcriptional regulator/tetratricopeptide (TPR) repeat protein